MGRNVDLIQTLSVGEVAECPKCMKFQKQNFDDYPMRPNTNPHPGEWNVWCSCPDCGHEWEFRMKVSLTFMSGPFPEENDVT